MRNAFVLKESKTFLKESKIFLKESKIFLKVVVNENGLNSVGGEESQSLTFQGGATVDLPCRRDSETTIVMVSMMALLPNLHDNDDLNTDCAIDQVA